MQRIFNHYLIIPCLLLIYSYLLSGCTHAEPTEISIVRYDRLQYEYALYNSFTTLQKINNDYPQHTKLLIEDVLGICQIEDPEINVKLYNYNQDTLIRVARHDVNTRFDDLSSEELLLSKAFDELRKEIPGLKVPQVYSQMGGFNQSIVVGDSILGISLEKYLGTDYPLYPLLYHDFQIKSMRRERLVPDALVSFLQVTFPLCRNTAYPLIDRICFEGKINWVIYKALKAPSYEWMVDMDDDGAEWCRAHAEEIRSYLTRSDIRNSTDFLLYRQLLFPAPYTRGLGKDSPDCIGQWAGIRIIDEYMKNNPEVTIHELLLDHDYEKIIVKAGYTP